MSSCLRQEEGGESAKERAEAKDKEGEYGGELGKVDNHRGEEDGNSSHNLTKGNLDSRMRMKHFEEEKSRPTPCPLMTVGKISLLYWRQMK